MLRDVRIRQQRQRRRRREQKAGKDNRLVAYAGLGDLCLVLQAIVLHVDNRLADVGTLKRKGCVFARPA